MANQDRVTTALLLAAGTGTRLQPLTDNAPKCLTLVQGIPILERLVHTLQEQKFKRLVVVVGYMEDHIRAFLKEKTGGMQVDFITSPVYRTTNNIYSLWLAQEQIQEPFLLVESDLVFDASMLEGMLQPDKIAISRTLPWMNGTTVTVDANKQVTAFHASGSASDAQQYKTVNIYSLSLPTWKEVQKRLDSYISGGRVGEYYEAIFTEMVADGSLHFEADFFNPDRWYEVDTLVDLNEVEKMFSGRSYPSIKPSGHPIHTAEKELLASGCPE
ncbi:MAG: phosphocholine cytidylyltransferase family protein [Candidatus Thiodiazotropha sp. (ex Dulcina madagascariensis)]|nr:phosphocholine cytidylyltransferase family protein [Candidatus Thiodiazotropha sp. (ex Dulcina madagascariensis)]MCU7928179.1 phosphocholine cytidylyltransferase family protein [Candidatus Thiodiazotropha sp. (ex Dulcina madagascariensis)]